MLAIPARTIPLRTPRKGERPCEHGIPAGEEVGRRRLDRHVDRRLRALVPRRAELPVRRRDVERQPDPLERDRRRVAPLARRAAGRLADEPRGRAAIDVGDEVSRSRERRPSGEDDELALDGRPREHVEQRGVGGVVAAVVEADVDDDTPHGRLPREREETLGEVVGVIRRQPVAEVDDLAVLQRRQPLRVVDAAQPDRVVLGLQRRGRSAERRRDLARVDRLERRLAAVGERERRVALDDPEAAQHLGGRDELRQQPAEPRLVVVRHERPDLLDHLVDRSAVDRRDATPGQILVADRADDVEPVGEVVEPEGVDVERAGVLVEGVDRRVAVARAGKGGETHQPDHELVPAQLRRLVGERGRLRAERRPRHVVEEVRMRRLHRVGQRAQLLLERRRRLRLVGARAAREEEGEDHEPAHPPSERSGR